MENFHKIVTNKCDDMSQEAVDWNGSVLVLQAKHYSTNHLMVTMGSDFQYQAAHNWYLNLDKLIHYVNARVRLWASLSFHAVFLFFFLNFFIIFLLFLGIPKWFFKISMFKNGVFL